jgi:hypothetical protein
VFGAWPEYVHDLPKERFISIELLQGFRHIPRYLAFFLHLSFVPIDARIVAAFRYLMEYSEVAAGHLLRIEGLGV